MFSHTQKNGRTNETAMILNNQWHFNFFLLSQKNIYSGPSVIKQIFVI